MKLFNTITVITVSSALMLGGCITYPDGTQKTSKTAMYGLGGAAACGIIGALTHGGKGARNSALACGAVGAGIGGYMNCSRILDLTIVPSRFTSEIFIPA